MKPISLLIEAANRGDQQAAAELLPAVYEELRKLAAAKLTHEQPGQTLTSTALVHEAYLRLIGDQQFENRRHFFAAAAEAMRRILVEAARRRTAEKRGGGSAEREALDRIAIPASTSDEQLLNINGVLDDLTRLDPDAATLVKLRFFSGMTMTEVADSMGMSVRSAHDLWAYARTWLHRYMKAD